VASRFEVTARDQPRQIIDPDIKAIAETIRRDAASFTPRDTGTMAGNWRVVKAARTHGTWRVTNYTPYAFYVEFGTRNMQAQAPLGRATARQDRRS
jgi:hypothetical protein